MTLLAKRMLEKKAGNFLTDGDIRNIFNQFDRWASQPLRSLLLASVFGGCPPWVSHGRCCRDSNGYLGAHDLAIVYRSLGENLEDDLVILPARMLCGCAGVWVWVYGCTRSLAGTNVVIKHSSSQIDELIREADKDGDGQIGMCSSVSSLWSSHFGC